MIVVVVKNMANSMSWWSAYVIPILYSIVVIIMPNSIVVSVTDDCSNPDNSAQSTKLWLYTTIFAPSLFCLVWLVFFPVVTVHLKHTVYQHRGFITTPFNIIIYILIIQGIATLIGVFPICGGASVQNVWLIVELFILLLSSIMLVIFVESFDSPTSPLLSDVDDERHGLLSSPV